MCGPYGSLTVPFCRSSLHNENNPTGPGASSPRANPPFDRCPMYRMFVGCALATMMLVAPSMAAPRPGEKPTGPAVVGQCKSLNDMLSIVKLAVKNTGGEALQKKFETDALPEIDPAKLPGIDPKRPFGLYATVDAEFAKSRVVLMVPVPGEKEFMEMIGGMGIKTTVGKEPGTFDVVVPPDFPLPVAGRIYKGYAYIALGGFDALDSKTIIDPAVVISEKETAVAAISVRPERVPPEAKKFMLGFLREQSDSLRDMIPEEELKAPFELMQKLVLRWLKSIFDDGRDVSLRLEADPKTADLVVEISVEGLPKTTLADAIAKRKPTTNAFASIAGDDFVQRVFVSAPLFADEAKEALVKLVEYWDKMAGVELQAEKAEVRDLVKAGLTSLKKTLDSGEMDLALAMRGPDKEGFYSAVGAIHCQGTAELEKAARAAMKLIPQEEQKYFKLDASKIGDLSVHEIDLNAEAEDIAKKIFGKGNKAYIAFGKSAIYASYGPDGMKLLKEAIEAKRGPAASFDSVADGKKSKDLMQRLIADKNPNAKQMMAMGAWESAFTGMRVTVTGGDKLRVRVGYNFGFALMMLGFEMN